MLAKEAIFQLDMAMDVRILSVDERWLKADLKKKLLEQKSRITRINEGDTNTAFFHSQAAQN